ncbi:MAG: hypothetical protein ACK5MV_03855 [Aminipila sp.]
MSQDNSLEEIIASKEQQQNVGTEDKPILQARTTNYSGGNLDSRIVLNSRSVLETAAHEAIDSDNENSDK